MAEISRLGIVYIDFRSEISGLDSMGDLNGIFSWGEESRVHLVTLTLHKDPY